MDGAALCRLFQNILVVYADDLPTRRLRAEPDRTPYEPDPDYPKCAVQESAPITRSFSSEFPTVTRLQPG